MLIRQIECCITRRSPRRLLRIFHGTRLLQRPACVSRLEPKRLALHGSGRATYGRRIQKRVYVRVLCMPPSRLLPIFSMGKFTVHKPVTVSCNTETLWCMDGCVESDFASQV